MSTRLRGVAITALSVVAVACPAIALGADHTPADKGDGLSYCDSAYLDLYKQADELGHPLGHNAVKEGIDDDKRICKQVDKLNEVVVSLTTPVVPETEAAAPVTTSTGGYAIPDYIVACESGGDYTASNPSGAYGAYQIMPETAAGYGCDLSTPAGQDACAAEIYATEGAAPWDCG
jgi:hypothetical protein